MLVAVPNDVPEPTVDGRTDAGGGIAVPAELVGAAVVAAGAGVVVQSGEALGAVGI